MLAQCWAHLKKHIDCNLKVLCDILGRYRPFIIRLMKHHKALSTYNKYTLLQMSPALCEYLFICLQDILN